MFGSWCILLTFFISTVWAQQLQDTPIPMPYSWLSASCLDALNTSVACPYGLYPLAQSGGILDDEGVEALCQNSPSCLSSLQSARSTISGACTETTDVIVIEQVAYPATYFADMYIYTYDLSCRQDSTTGEYCDPQILAWSNSTLSTNQSCSDCWLGGLALQLNSPLGYDSNLAAGFANLTSSCNVTGYATTTPTPYALNATATTVPASVTATPPPACTGSYTVLATDNCISVSRSLNVSTYDLVVYNNIDIYCQNFAAAVGSNLCIPIQCQTYTWQALDTCNSVASGLSGVTVPQFLSWNGNLNSLCQNAGAFIGYQFCVGPPGGFLNTTSTNSSMPGSATTAAPVPTNAMTGSNTDCGEWYIVKSNDTCAVISVAHGLPLSDFYFLNPEVSLNCTNLDVGIAYCVEAVGAISTYSGYPTTTTTAWITVPPATWSSLNTAIPTPTSDPGYVYTPSLLPTASGTIAGCDSYQNYDNTTEADCDYIAFAYDITDDELLQWNPSLSTNLSICSLQAGYSYCVELTNTTTPTSESNCIPVDNFSNDTTIMSGTAANCNCYMIVNGYDSGSYSCEDIETDYSVTATQLTTWNTWLASDCDANLYANLNVSDARPVCVGVNGTTIVGTTTTSSVSVGATTTTPTPTTTTPTTTITNAPTGPTPSGEIAGCQVWYTVQSGDSCSSIETAYNITFFQFFGWNPIIGSTCNNLLVSDAYCVQGPASSGTATVSLPAPTQTGLSSNCDAFYTVQSGDSCSSIETKFNITFAQLYQWNPAIGSDCEALWIGYGVCVGISL